MAQLGDGLNGYLDVQDATLRAPRLEAVSNISIANTNPQHAFSVGSNLYVSTESSDVLTVKGNVVTEGIKMGFLEILPSYDLAAVSNVGNITSNTIIFDNPTQGFVATGNATIGSTLTISGFRITAAAAAEDDLQAITTAGADTTNAIRVRNGTESTSFDTGALQVGTNTGANGGLGVAGNVHVAQGVYTQDFSVDNVISNLAVNTSDLFVDIVNSRVGIGKTEPTVALDVVGAVNATGNVAVDTNTLFVDSVGNKVGVGTTEPGATLEVTGNAFVSANLEVGTAELFVDTINSRVGIGTTNPGSALDVVGDVAISSNLAVDTNTLFVDSVGNKVGIGVTSPQAPFHVKPVNNNVDAENTLLDFRGDFTGSNHGYLGIFATETHTNAVGPDLRFKGAVYNGTGSPTINQVMCLKPNGNVGIGTTNPGALLDLKKDSTNAASIQFESSGGYKTSIGQKSSSTADRAFQFTSYGSSAGDSPVYNFLALNSDEDAYNKILTMTGNGNVGIGTENPIAKFHVNGVDGRIWGLPTRTFDDTYALTYNANAYYGDPTVSIWASGKIFAGDLIGSVGGTITASDERIKTNIIDISDGDALTTLRMLKPKKYHYKDTIRRGNESVWGFIAQEVANTLPYSTETTTNFLPNIYEMASVSNSNVITFTNFDTSSLESNASVIKVNAKDGTDHLVKLVEVIDTRTIRVEEDLSKWTGTIDEMGNQLFIYGQQVDDFVFLKKDAIWTVATAALQEVDRQLQAEKTRNDALETQLSSVLTRLDALESA